MEENLLALFCCIGGFLGGALGTGIFYLTNKSSMDSMSKNKKRFTYYSEFPYVVVVTNGHYIVYEFDSASCMDKNQTMLEFNNGDEAVIIPTNQCFFFSTQQQVDIFISKIFSDLRTIE